MPSKIPGKILLIDGFSILNRAFYAIPLLTAPSGEFTNAVYGFLNILFRFLDEEKPDYLTVAFDLPQPTFRHEAYGAYKGTRKSMPDELRAQVPILKGLLAKMQIKMAECPGFEADDIIGTLANLAEANGLTAVIISGDRDLLQLATDSICIRLPKTRAGKTEVEDYHAADVLAKYGVSPRAYIDVKALMGDASDNIPGVPGIGEVTATKIIAAYGSIEAAIENATDVKPKKAAENLAEFKDQAILSKHLATIVQDAPVELHLSTIDGIQSNEAMEEILRLGLKKLYKRFEGVPTETETMPAKAFSYNIAKTPQEAADYIAGITGDAAIYPLWEAGLIGVALASNHAPAMYIPINMGGGEQISLEALDSKDDLLEIIRPWLESAAPKLTYDAKAELGRFRKADINLGGITSDAMLAAYLLNPLQANHSPTDLAEHYLQEDIPKLEDILENKGKRGKDRKSLSDLPIDSIANHATRCADTILRCNPIMDEALAASGQTQLYKGMELPLVFVLDNMEKLGIGVNKEILTGYGEVLSQRVNALTTEIHSLAGEEFNINSPSQLGVILFQKLGLRSGKKTATANFSTAADVLEKLKTKHPIIPLVLEYRAHAKLKSTYVDGMLPLVSRDSRVHSTFHQALTATGRLSSAEPNLQNIPVRLPLGRELRKAFVPRAGYVFMAADYSQIELRLLAHMSGDEVLINAFKKNEDIHRLTASQVLGLRPEDVTPLQRSNAKAVNFGIVYGISAYGLSDDLGISVKEAEGYIAGYFEKYPGVKEYLDKTVRDARKNGYVATMYNRRRPMPELKSSNYNTRSFGERVAMNMPLQGTAADIIKIAMINVTQRITNEGLNSRLILQVHDELMLEVPLPEVEQMTKILSEEMENAAELKIPLIAEVNVGDNWYDTK